MICYGCDRGREGGREIRESEGVICYGCDSEREGERDQREKEDVMIWL